MAKKYCVFLVMMILALSGCSFAPQYTKPKTDLPPEPAKMAEGVSTIKLDWWKNYGDENLNLLIAEALKNNDDLKLAVARLEEAKARLGLAEANRYPNVNAGAAAIRQKTAAGMPPFGMETTENFFSLSATVAYELDLWGRIRNQRQAALSTMLAGSAAKDALRLGLVANVATVYFNLVSLSRQIETTENILGSYKSIYEFRLKQYQYGILEEIVVQQAKAQYESVKILLEDLREQDSVLKSALSLLLGRTPQEIFAKLTMVENKLPAPIAVPALLPSKLLENRPDIAEAEEALKATNFQIGVARAAYFPSLSLTGALGLQSVELDNLMNASARVWNVGGNITAPLLDFGRIKANVKITEARQQEALIHYIKTVKAAFKEAYDALIRVAASRNKLQAQEDEMQAWAKILTLATKKYEAGTADYLAVLDAQRGYLSTSLNLISRQTEVINNQVVLYKVLGGGWDRDSLASQKSP